MSVADIAIVSAVVLAGPVAGAAPHDPQHLALRRRLLLTATAATDERTAAPIRTV